MVCIEWCVLSVFFQHVFKTKTDLIIDRGLILLSQKSDLEVCNCYKSELY